MLQAKEGRGVEIAKNIRGRGGWVRWARLLVILVSAWGTFRFDRCFSVMFNWRALCIQKGMPTEAVVGVKGDKRLSWESDHEASIIIGDGEG